MAHIVCITGGLTGMLNASLALAAQLQQAGHQITYASPADLHAPVSAQGIDYIQLAPWVMQWGDPPMGRWQQWRSLKARQQQAVDALGMREFIPTVESLSPDLLLIDMEMHPHVMAAVMAKLPVALLCQFLSIWQRPNLPPIHTSVVPGQGWTGGKWAIAGRWWQHCGAKWLEFQRERWRRMGLDWISVLRCYAQQIGYPWNNPWRPDQWLLPYTHGDLPILCFNALELDFPHPPHPLMHYVGPMVLANRQESRVDNVTADSLEEIFTRCHRPGRSLIYCSCSTFVKGDQQFLRRLITAVSNRSDWELILGLGGQLNPDEFPNLPNNIHAFTWVPQLKVLQRADCAINNGGINSINECLYFGVPMVVYSLNRFDQNGDAARVAYHGLGLTGDIVHDSPQQIGQRIASLLTDQRYQTRAKSMEQCYRRYGEENRAAQVVSSLLAQSAVSSPLAPDSSNISLGGALL